MRYQPWIVGSLLLAGLLVSPPVFAAEPADPPGQTADRLCKIERQIDDLKQEVAKLKELAGKTATQLDRLNEEVLLPALTQLNKSMATVKAVNDDVEKLKQAKADADKLQALLTRVEAIERELNGVREVQRRFYPPNLPGAPGAQAPPAAPTGQVLLINDWVTPVQVVVDGVSFVLQPGQRQPVAKVPGMITYEVLGISGPRTTTVLAGQTRNIHVHP